jgi:hypothetical protein
MLFDYIYSLGTFEKLRKAILIFIMSVRWEQLNSHQSVFNDISYLRIFRKSVEKFQFPLRSERITGLLHEAILHV